VFTNASPLSVKADNFKHSGPALWYDMAVFEPIEINKRINKLDNIRDPVFHKSSGLGI
jgi:hypothetical protein